MPDRSAVRAVLLVVGVRVIGVLALALVAASSGRSAHARLVRWDAQWYAGIARAGYGHTVLQPDAAATIRSSTGCSGKNA